MLRVKEFFHYEVWWRVESCNHFTAKQSIRATKNTV